MAYYDPSVDAPQMPLTEEERMRLIAPMLHLAGPQIPYGAALAPLPEIGYQNTLGNQLNPMIQQGNFPDTPAKAELLGEDPPKPDNPSIQNPQEPLEPNAPVAAPPPSENEKRFAMISGLLGNAPATPKAPDFGEAREVMQAGIKQQEDLIKATQDAAVEHAAKVKTEIETGATAINNMRAEMKKTRAEVDRAINDQVAAQMYPNVPAHVESPAQWVAEQKSILQSGVASPELKEQAAKNLEKAQAQGGTKQVLGEWWQVLLAALAMGAGGFSSAMTGGPNQAMSIIMGAIDRKQQEEDAKSERLQKTLAAREKLGVLNLERSREDYDMALQNKAANLELLKNGLDAEMAKITSQEQLAKLSVLRGQMIQQIEQYKDERALNIFNTKMQASMGYAKIGAELAKSAGVRGFGGLVYKEGAQPLSDAERKSVRDTSVTYKTLSARLDELIKKAGDMSAAGYVSWTPEGRQLARAFGATIDAIRKSEEWGAKFEQTEAGVLIPAYLGKEEASDFGFFLDVLRKTKRDFQNSYRGFLDSYDMQEEAKTQASAQGVPKAGPGR